MLSLDAIRLVGVDHISKRLFLVIVLCIAMGGVTGILFYSLPHYWESDAQDKVPPYKVKPTHATSIPGDSKQQFKLPLNLFVAENSVYIADSGNYRLSVLTQAGKLESSIDLDPDSLNASPLGVAVDTQRRIYVSTTGKTGDTIMVLNAEGRFLYNFPEKAGSTAAYITPGKPVALFCANNKLYVTDIIDHDIKIYGLNGELITRIGRPGNAKGEFLYPNGIAADEHGYIYISDSNNSRVQVFDEKGEFSHLFTTPKSNPLALPRGIDIDNFGRVHVVDALKHKVFVFTKSGEYLFSYGEFGTEDDSLSYPNGIAIDKKTGKIFIADKGNNRISVWK